MERKIMIEKKRRLLKKGDIGFKTILGIILALMIFFVVLSIIMGSTDFMVGFIPKLFRFGR